MPFRAQVSHARHTLLYSLAASATVSCILSFILIHFINQSSQKSSIDRHATQALELIDGLERSLLRQRREIKNLEQIPTRSIDRNLRLAASGLEVDQVLFFNGDGKLFHASKLHPFPAPQYGDTNPGVQLALNDKSTSNLDHAGDRWFVRAFVPVHNGKGAVIAAALVLIDMTQTRNLFVHSNRESLFVVIALILASTAILYLIGNAFIGRMGDAIQARTASEEELDRAQSLARVGLMVAGLSHQLRNPLSILNGIVGALNRRPALDEQRPFLSALTEETARIIHLSEVFLDFATPIKAKIKDCSVREVIRRLEVFLENNSPKTKVTVLGSKEIEYKLDQELIFQALMNIALNSIDAVPRDKIPQILVTFGIAKGALSIQISDNGDGFSVEELAQLGNTPQPFYSTKAKGSGLGLAIADKIANAHDGRIEFNNNPTGGARVTLILPSLQNG